MSQEQLSRALGLAESLATTPDRPRIEGVREVAQEIVDLLKSALASPAPSRGRIEQEYANEQVRQLRKAGFCPVCGVEDGRDG